MANTDRLLYFPVRVRAEPTRILYSISNTPLDDETITFDDWPSKKNDTPAGQIPILFTKDGVINQSNVIFRYAAKKLGLYGNGLWEETIHDMVIENTLETVNQLLKIYGWTLFKFVPEPENAQQTINDVREKWIKTLNYIQTIAESRGRKFIVNDEIGAADVWLYASLELSKHAYPDIMSLTTWTKEFVEKMESDSRIKKYVKERPESVFGV